MKLFKCSSKQKENSALAAILITAACGKDLNLFLKSH